MQPSFQMAWLAYLTSATLITGIIAFVLKLTFSKSIDGLLENHKAELQKEIEIREAKLELADQFRQLIVVEN